MLPCRSNASTLGMAKEKNGFSQYLEEKDGPWSSRFCFWGIPSRKSNPKGGQANLLKCLPIFKVNSHYDSCLHFFLCRINFEILYHILAFEVALILTSASISRYVRVHHIIDINIIKTNSSKIPIFRNAKNWTHWTTKRSHVPVTAALASVYLAELKRLSQ